MQTNWARSHRTLIKQPHSLSKYYKIIKLSQQIYKAPNQIYQNFTAILSKPQETHQNFTTSSPATRRWNWSLGSHSGYWALSGGVDSRRLHYTFCPNFLSQQAMASHRNRSPRWDQRHRNCSPCWDRRHHDCPDWRPVWEK